jgi:hypothetical protein
VQQLSAVEFVQPVLDAERIALALGLARRLLPTVDQSLGAAGNNLLGQAALGEELAHSLGGAHGAPRDREDWRSK